jgi:hypothetical protein
METSIHTTSESSAVITYPTINSLIDALGEMQTNGCDPNTPLMISQLANALGTFYIYTIKN